MSLSVFVVFSQPLPVKAPVEKAGCCRNQLLHSRESSAPGNLCRRVFPCFSQRAPSARARARTHTHTHARTRKHSYTRARARVRAHTHTHTLTYQHTHTHIHKHTRTHTHTHTQRYPTPHIVLKHNICM